MSQPVVAQLPGIIEAWNDACQAKLNTMAKSRIEEATSKNYFNVYVAIALPILAVLLSTILLGVYAGNHTSGSPFTYTATMGSLTLTGIAVDAIAITYIISYALRMVDKGDNERRLAMELETLRNMAQVDNTSGNYRLNDLVIKKSAFTQKEGELQKALNAELQKKNSSWSAGRVHLDGYVQAFSIGILTLLGTIFASEYLSNVLTDTSAQGATAGIFFAGAGLVTAKLFHVINGAFGDKASQKEVTKFLQPLALFVLSLVGTIFASEYFPRLMNSTVAAGLSATIGVVGFTATIISLAHKCLDESERFNAYDNKLLYGWHYDQYVLKYGYYADPSYRGERKDIDIYLAAYKKLKLSENTKVALLSWFVPLTIAMITMSLGLYEGTLGDCAPYLIPTSTLIGALVIATHIVHTCLTARSTQQLRDAAEYEITHRTDDPAPTKGS